MKDTRIIMGMPVTVEIADARATGADLEKIFSYFVGVDERFSPFKRTSELSRMNAGAIRPEEASADMREVLGLAEETKRETDGYFDIRKPGGLVDTSGIVKGWAIKRAADMLARAGFTDYYVDAGGDIQVAGRNGKGEAWTIGIRDPFDPDYLRIVKAVRLARGEGIATSGTSVRGQHIWNPRDPSHAPITDIVSVTVIGPDIHEADRFATAAFAMGRRGIAFLESRPGLEAYMIDAAGIATMTSGFERYIAS